MIPNWNFKPEEPLGEGYEYFWNNTQFTPFQCTLEISGNETKQSKILGGGGCFV